jgi:murein DD-endopeptidase MepM/ murein hydrolase activator NlpD
MTRWFSVPPVFASSVHVRPSRAVVGLACVLAVAAGLLHAAPPAVAQTVDGDVGVVEARARLASEQQRAAQLAERLDAAAGAYERAHAHQVRLADEVGVQVRAVDAAGAEVDAAERAFARSVAESYMHPGGEAALAGAVALAPDAGTALHRAALVERVAAGERLRAAQVRIAAARTTDEGRQHEVIRAGVAGAVEQAEREAATLEDLLEAARAEAVSAGTAVAVAEDAARARIAAEAARVAAAERAAAERAAAERAAAQVRLTAFTGVAAPLPSVDGRVCPIGAPNGFIDSWGFPRSGGRRHQGVDMFAVYGMPLYAVADGVVTRVFNNRLGGLSVDLVDDGGTRYYYAHLSAAHVSAGQRVRAGEVIAANGNSGNARTTPPHLHWQVHPGGGAPVNPYPLAAALCR